MAFMGETVVSPINVCGYWLNILFYYFIAQFIALQQRKFIYFHNFAI